MECPFCGAENRDSSRYCGNCGRLMTGTGATGQTATVVNTKVNSSSLSPGENLQSGRYIIKSVLGAGGMGTALLATDTRLDDKPVVIKELVSDSSDPVQVQEDVRNFRGEVSVLARIDHPLVPNVTDHFQEGKHYFMVQEYAAGENLEDHLDRLKAPMPEAEVLGYASAVLDILDYLEHQTPPIIHRDIKPANIIIGAKDKRPRLVDFGIARADTVRNAQRKQTSALGTPGYAPPEQYQGNADARSDLYALAATMHHLLTNRDPREHPPFIYPSVRSLNGRLSPETDRILEKALINDPSKRYQTAIEMKEDIDELLMSRFGGVQNTGSYTLGPSAPLKKTTPTQTASRTQPAQSTQPARPNVQSPPPVYGGGRPQLTPVPPSRGYQAPYPQQQNVPPRAPAQRGSNVGRNFVLFLIVIVVLGIFAYAAYNGVLHRSTTGTSTGSSQSSQSTSATLTASASKSTVGANGIGAVTASNKDLIGISDGSVIFDTTRSNAAQKVQGAQAFSQKNTSEAASLWQSAVNEDTRDAEALIYLEDQRVLSSGKPYITLVVGTILSGNEVGIGQDDLQGAYTAQKEYNDSNLLPGGTQLRLLIANAGTSSTNASQVAQQIVQAAKADKTIIGVMGWPFSTHAINALNILAPAHIPMVSPTASSDLLSNSSPYFFRVAPSNKDEAIVGAKYTESKLGAKKVALFVDPADAYSGSLANDFKNQFMADGNQIVTTIDYTAGQTNNFPDLVQKALAVQPDAIYFAGQGSDVGALLTDLPSTGSSANIPVVGGDSLYQLGGYPSSARPNFHRLHFTAFAYPDIWGYLGKKQQQPAFFSDYIRYFDPNNQHPNSYGYQRTSSDVMLSYDAMQALLNASKSALTGKSSITSSDLQQGLAKITATNRFQGVSGQIGFGSDGNPVNKLIVVLKVTPQNFIAIESTSGQFTK